MSLIGRMLKGLQFAKEADNERAPVGEVGWSETTLFQAAFGKYNPDDLIGRKGFDIYRRMMFDEQVKAVVRFKRDAITSREWFFDAPEELEEEEQERRISLSKAIINEMQGNITDSLNGILTGMYNGFSMTEVVHKQIMHDGLTYYGVDKLRLRPFETFRFKTDQHGNAEQVIQQFEEREQIIDMDRFIHYVQSPEEDIHYGQSELRAAYRAYWSKDVIIKLYNIFMERVAAGFTYAQPKEGVTVAAGSATETALKSVLANITNKTSILLPSGIELNVVHPSGKPGYVEAIAMHDKAIAKALLVPNLLGISEQGQTGSYAQSSTQFDAFLMTLDADATRLEEALNEQLFRRLANYNWGDMNYPKFKFKPMSDTKKFELLGLWKEMVTSGAVKHSERDEDRVRNLMDFPKRTEEGENIPQKALDSGQIAAMKDIILEYKKGALDQVTAAKLISVTFPIEYDDALELLGEQSQPAGEPSPPPSVPGPDNGQEEDTGEGSPQEFKAHAFSEAIKRVDFAVIKQKTEQLEEEYVKDVQAATNSIVAFVTKKSSLDPEEVAQIEIPVSLKEPLRRAFGRMLKANYELGLSHARAETSKTKSFAAGSPDPLGDAASAYFKSKSFTMAGSLSDRILSKTQNTIFNGIKNGAALPDIRDEIAQVLASEGITGKEPYMIDTMVRTTAFEAINEARFNYFRDPSLGDFVEALEYSAIMDDRTTQICSHLDGKTYAKDSDIWAAYRPPNHFNCRSILIAVTVDDQWSESNPPTIAPQEGFK